jgi:WD40 repeat protein|tara:strand:+ start:1006 stop:1218 length:213 start_codon:yes stop_codon:yes gene_type:complete
MEFSIPFPIPHTYYERLTLSAFIVSAYLVTASSDASARLWDCASGEAIRIYSGHHKAAVCCALNDSAVDV